MIDLIFPDGSKRPFDDGVTGKDVATSIAHLALAKRAVLVKLDGELLDPRPGAAHGGKFEILRAIRRRSWRPSATTPPRDGRRRCRSLSPARRSRSDPRSRTASTTTSPAPSRSAGRPRHDRTADEGDRRQPTRNHAQRSGSATRPSPTSSPSASSTRPRSYEGIPAGEDVSVYRQGKLEGPLHAAALLPSRGGSARRSS